MLTLAIIATVLMCIQPIPASCHRDSWDTFIVFVNVVFTITTIWVLYAHVA